MTRPSSPTGVYLDSCILIDYLQRSPTSEVARAMQLVDAGSLPAYISTAHYVEVLGDSQAATFSADQEDRVLTLLRHPRLTMVEVSRFLMLRAREYRIHRRLKALDAIHLAAAVETDANVLWTYDKTLLSQDYVDGVWITEPYEPGTDTPINGL